MVSFYSATLLAVTMTTFDISCDRDLGLAGFLFRNCTLYNNISGTTPRAVLMLMCTFEEMLGCMTTSYSPIIKPVAEPKDLRIIIQGRMICNTCCRDVKAVL